MTSAASAKAATEAAVQRFGRIDVLVNNADAAIRPWWESMNGQQQGDPAKLAAALLQIVDQDDPPLRWVAGADAVAAVEQKARDLVAQVYAYRELSTSLAHDAVAAGS